MCATSTRPPPPTAPRAGRGPRPPPPHRLRRAVRLSASSRRMACAARRSSPITGSMRESLTDNVSGFKLPGVHEAVQAVDRAGTLDRVAIRATTVDRFARAAMVERYVAAYRPCWRPVRDSDPAIHAASLSVDDRLGVRPDVRDTAVRALHRVAGQHRSVERVTLHRHPGAHKLPRRRTSDRDRSQRPSQARAPTVARRRLADNLRTRTRQTVAHPQSQFATPMTHEPYRRR